jgi:hypothetical protein
MVKRVALDDKIELSGQDISAWTESWNLVSKVDNVRIVELRLHVDDNFKVNGRTVDEMLGIK